MGGGMSPWVLLLYLGMGNGGGPVALDMPSRAVCEATEARIERDWNPGWTFHFRSWCIDRTDAGKS